MDAETELNLTVISCKIFDLGTFKNLNCQKQYSQSSYVQFFFQKKIFVSQDND